MNRKLSVAIVGCGQIADAHVEEVQKLKDADLVAVCDREPILAEQLATRFGVPRYYEDFELVLKETEPDVVHICTPPASHPLLVEQSVNAGAHAYVEKPFAVNLAAATQMVEIAEAAGKLLTIGHNSHFDPAAMRLRKLLADGAIGEVVHVESWYGYDLSGSFGKLIQSSPDHWVHALPGRLLQNNINHLLHKLTEFISDDEPEIVTNAWRTDDRCFGDRRDLLMDEMRLVIRGELVSGFGVFTARARPQGHGLVVHGSKGNIRVDYNSRSVIVDRGVVLPSAIGRLASSVDLTLRQTGSAVRNLWHFATNRYHYFAGMSELIQQFYSAIRRNGEPPIPHAEILRVTRLMDQIFAQIGEKQSS